MGDELTETVDIKRGVQQGCVPSPDLFILYEEIIMRETERVDCFCIEGRNVNNIRYTDDTVLVVDSVENFQALLDVVNRASERRN